MKGVRRPRRDETPTQCAGLAEGCWGLEGSVFFQDFPAAVKEAN